MIIIKIVENLGTIKPHYILITGDGLFDIRIFKGFCKKFNGQDIVIWIANKGFLKKTGLHALDSLKVLPKEYKICSIICILDGDSFLTNNSRASQIKNHLRTRGISVQTLRVINDSFHIECRDGNLQIELYVYIAGPDIFIEENIIRLLRVSRNIEIDVSGEHDQQWKDQIKREVREVLRRNGIILDKYIPTVGVDRLREAFPSLSAILGEIEERHKK